MEEENDCYDRINLSKSKLCFDSFQQENTLKSKKQVESISIRRRDKINNLRTLTLFGNYTNNNGCSTQSTNDINLFDFGLIRTLSTVDADNIISVFCSSFKSNTLWFEQSCVVSDQHKNAVKHILGSLRDNNLSSIEIDEMIEKNYHFFLFYVIHLSIVNPNFYNESLLKSALLTLDLLVSHINLISGFMFCSFFIGFQSANLHKSFVLILNNYKSVRFHHHILEYVLHILGLMISEREDIRNIFLKDLSLMNSMLAILEDFEMTNDQIKYNSLFCISNCFSIQPTANCNSVSQAIIILDYKTIFCANSILRAFIP